MRLLVATYNSVFVTEDGKVVRFVIETGQDLGHYGLTWSGDYMFILCQRGNDQKGTDQWVAVLDHDLAPVCEVLRGEIAGTHQILWHDDCLWCCSTNSDDIVVATATGEKIGAWKPNPDAVGGDHINSIWFDGESVFTLAHRYGPAVIREHSYPELNLLNETEAALSGHNICRVNGKLLSLGIRGEVYWGERLKTDTPRLLKGLAVTQAGEVMVGYSKVIEDRVSRRKDLSGSIGRLDLSTKRILHIGDFGLGPVNEIRVLDVPDLAHHGQPWTGRYGV